MPVSPPLESFRTIDDSTALTLSTPHGRHVVYLAAGCAVTTALLLCNADGEGVPGDAPHQGVADQVCF